ncbi:MAG: hypothetical protein ABI132_03955 [Rhodanobacteraceae bacterium]
MSKQFKNKICVYCGGLSTTGDHVIARDFFPLSSRANLPIVPACAACNNAKSALEHYLATILPGGSAHPVAIEVQRKKLGARLAKNRRLTRELGAGMRPLPNGWGSIPLRADTVQRYMQFVAKGLAFHHFGVVIDSRFGVEGSVWRTDGPTALERMHEEHGDRLTRITASFADGAFEYIAHVARDYVPLSLWQIRLYGGVAMGGEGNDLEPGGYEFGAAIMLAKPRRPIWGTGWG